MRVFGGNARPGYDPLPRSRVPHAPARPRYLPIEPTPNTAPDPRNAAETARRATEDTAAASAVRLDRSNAHHVDAFGAPLARRIARDRLRILTELLHDESPSVFEAVRAELLRAGRSAEPALRRAAGDPRARVRGRARAILATRERRAALRRLLGMAGNGAVDLESALFRLGRLERPDLDARPYKKALDAMGLEVARRAANELDSFARPMVLAQYLGGELGFIGSETDFTHPDNIHLHRAIERKCGMPLTLTAIYLFVARRAGLRAAAVALPGRVLLRLYAGRRSMLVDPFLGGKARTRMDCIRYLAHNGLVPRPDWFHDATDTALFQRHVLNLMSSCQIRGLDARAHELHRLAVEIGRHKSDA